MTDDFDLDPNESGLDQDPTWDAELVVRGPAAALYVSLLKARLSDEAGEFAEWYLETFDHDLKTGLL